MDATTRAYEERPSARTYCAHCRCSQKHEDRLDPKLGRWVSICTVCEMVELADDELAKVGRRVGEPVRVAREEDRSKPDRKPDTPADILGVPPAPITG